MKAFENKNSSLFDLASHSHNCIDCKNWAGRCLRAKVNRIAWSRTCEKIEPKYSVMYVTPEIVPIGATAPMEVKA